MDKETRQRFLDTWSELGYELLDYPELEESLIKLADDQELISEDSMYVPVANLLLLVSKWMTNLGIPTTFSFSQATYDQKHQEALDYLQSLQEGKK